jgi:phage FluMu protein Com
MEKPSFLQQLGFTIENGRMIVSENLSEKPYGKELIAVLNKNRLFKERPKNGYVFVIDYTADNPNTAIYNSDNWQQTDKKADTFVNPNHAAVVVVASQLISPEQFNQLIEDNKEKLNTDGGSFFVFEKGLNLPKEETQQIRDQRIEILESLGINVSKRVSIVKRQKGIVTTLLTQARFKKDSEHYPREVDLLTPRPDDPPEKQIWRKNIIPKIKAIYRNAGFTEIDTSAIEMRLRHSKNPPLDLAKARDGFGVKAKAPCGCEIQVDFNGNRFVHYHCQDHPKGIPNESAPLIKLTKQKELPTYILGEIALKQSCFDCGNNLHQSTAVNKVLPGNRAEILVEIKCPHCGVVSLQKKNVPQTAILNSRTSK